MKNTIFYHADDYGVNEKQSENIMQCFHHGVLNSVSIMPNSPKLDSCMDFIKTSYAEKKLRCVVHLNFIEGSCMAEAGEIPDLVDERGQLKNSFVSVLKMNYSSKRALFKAQLKKEISAQIAIVAKHLNTKKINVDSHQHFHMIPIVWEALMEVIGEEGYSIEYIRISLDPLSILCTTPAVWKSLRPVNLIKWGLLTFLCPSKKKLEATGAKIPVFFGLFFTCEMKTEVVKCLLPKYQKYAEKRNRELELMFHPGAVIDEADLLDASNEELKEFYASSNRESEKRTLMTL